MLNTSSIVWTRSMVFGVW